MHRHLILGVVRKHITISNLGVLSAQVLYRVPVSPVISRGFGLRGVTVQ
jgi:hypothetical protein